MFCNKCGNKLEDNDLFYSSCGAKVNRELEKVITTTVEEPEIVKETENAEVSESVSETQNIETEIEMPAVPEAHEESVNTTPIESSDITPVDEGLSKAETCKTEDTTKTNTNAMLIEPVVTAGSRNDEHILIKSNKKSQMVKKLIVWAITALLCIASAAYFAFDYKEYKKGQQFGIGAAILATGMSSDSWVDQKDPYEEQCYDVYLKLSKRSSDIVVNGVKYDLSEVRKAEKEVRESFEDVMKSAGYDRYESYNIENWFRYKNMAEYYIGYFWTKPLLICSYIAIVLAVIITTLVNREAKKEVIVYENSVVCKTNRKKSKQLMFEDIKNIGYGKNSLNIIGIGTNFKISNLTNAESVKNVIIDKKNNVQNHINNANMSAADELKKYKELLDSGVISQPEFEAKKKQILGL